MFDCRLLISTFIFVVIFASTVHSRTVEKNCSGGGCKCKVDGVEVPCDSIPEVPDVAAQKPPHLTPAECAKLTKEQIKQVNEVYAAVGLPPACPEKNQKNLYTPEQCAAMGKEGRKKANEVAALAGLGTVCP